MKALFTPLSIVVGLAAGQLSKKLFDRVWSAARDEDAPRPKHRDIQLAELVIALIIEGAIARLVRGLVDHGTRHGWAALMGEWPGEERPQAG
jgi:hypothetical protein